MLKQALYAAVILAAWFHPAEAATIVAHEEDKVIFREGRMDHSEGQFENTYYLDLDKDILTRTRVYDYQAKKITPDETVYQIQKQLRSHPDKSARFSVTPSIRAFGQPADDAVEIIVIKDDYVQSVVSTGDEIIISRAKRLK